MIWQFGFFDWNGTLLDDLEVVYQSVMEMFRRFGLAAPTLQEYRTRISSDFSDFYYENGIPRTITPAQLNQIRKEFLEKRWQEARLRKGVPELLRFSQDIDLKTGIVSAEVPAILAARLKQFNLEDLFFHIEGGAWPKIEALKRLAKKLGLQDGTRAFYLDDTPEGIRAAAEAGFATIGFMNGYAPHSAIRKARPNFTAHSFSDVRRIIQSA